MSDRRPAPARRDPDNKTMLASLVMGNSDLVGLLAYSMYSQFKEEWRAEFNENFGRLPNAHEISIFELGEQTARRKIMYRFLADARLTGEYRDIGADFAEHSFVQRTYKTAAKAAILGRSEPRRSYAFGGKAFAALLAFVLGIALPLTSPLHEPQPAQANVARIQPPAEILPATYQQLNGSGYAAGVPINPLD